MSGAARLHRLALPAWVVLAVVAVGWLPQLGLPTVALIAILMVVGAAPLLVRSWKVTLGILLIWLVFEDLLRKMSGNDIRVYFIKDLIYALLLIALFRDYRFRGAWRQATGSSRLALYALIGWAVIMAVPVAITDWRLAVIGLRVDFLYIPLVVVGFLIARESTALLARTLLFISVLGGIACGIGDIQAIVGPKFLAPSGPTPGLINLILLRSHGTVYEPTGTFVDPGRFGSMAVLSIGVSTAAFVLATGRARAVALIALLVSAAAVWVDGRRGDLVNAVLLLTLAASPAVLGKHRRSLTIALAVVAAVTLFVTAAAALLPHLLTSRFSWYVSTLNPFSSDNEWAFRWHLFSSNLQRGIHEGGCCGVGTGQESLGKQYLYGGRLNSTNGLYHVEGGYAAVLAEWGVVGLLIWVVWSVSWVGRQAKIVWAQRDQPSGHAGMLLTGWVFLFLFLGFVAGFQEFQNYVANAYFWLLSGLVFGMAGKRVVEADQTKVEVQGWLGPEDWRPAVAPPSESAHVLVLTTDPLGVGGIQLVTRTLISSLADLYGSGRVGLLQVWNHGTGSAPCLMVHSGTHVGVAGSTAVPISEKLRYFIAAVRAARRWRDRKSLLIAAHVHVALVAWVASMMSGRPYVVWCHGLEAWGPMGFGLRLAVRNAAAVFTSNRFTARRVEELVGLAPETVQVFPYGLPAGYKSVPSTTDGRPTVLSVARLAPEDAYKGIDTLICAWPQVEARVPDAHLEIIGDGQDRPRLVKMAETLGLNGNVHFAGRVSDEELHRAYARATVFAMPGRHTLGPPAQGEGFGMVFVEAGAAGLPVVAGRAAGAIDAVGQDESGLLVEPNDPTEVADAIVRLLTDPTLARRLGQGGRQRAEVRYSYLAFRQNIGTLVQATLGRKVD
jgi:glycosyltransferase involved in cell wall biosynthesis